MKFVLNNKRFKKRFTKKEKTKFSMQKKRISQYPEYLEYYNNLFDNFFTEENNKVIKTNCLCKKIDDIYLSLTDRHCLDFPTVVCKQCGLIRAKYYLKNHDLVNFYDKIYRSDIYNDYPPKETPQTLFLKTEKKTIHIYTLLDQHKTRPFVNLKIVDLGGGTGGALNHFSNLNKKYLFEYHEPYLNYAKKKNIITIKGGLDEIDFKPDIIIMSHLIEHWSNFENEIKKLISIQKKNETLNYIELPGIDSLKNGRRESDILGDIHVPHFYYFASYVFENVMNRYGFEKKYLDSNICSIFVYTGNKKNLINYFRICQNDLIIAEKNRKLIFVKNLIKFLLTPNFLIFIKKIKIVIFEFLKK